jgi:hypothetical protein
VALEQLVAIFGYDDQKSSAKDVLSRRNYVLCVSCDPPLYVCTAGVVRTQIFLPSEEDVDTADHRRATVIDTKR